MLIDGVRQGLRREEESRVRESASRDIKLLLWSPVIAYVFFVVEVSTPFFDVVIPSFWQAVALLAGVVLLFMLIGVGGWLSDWFVHRHEPSEEGVPERPDPLTFELGIGVWCGILLVLVQAVPETGWAAAFRPVVPGLTIVLALFCAKGIIQGGLRWWRKSRSD